MTAREYKKEGRLSRFSLDRRISVLVLLMTTLVVGFAAASRIPVELIPRGFDDPFLMVRVPWEDAPSKEVLDKVTIPLEEELSTVRGIKTLFTVSRTGLSIAWIPFKHGTDMDVAYREVRDRLERARLRFPDDIDKTYIQKHDASGIPVYMIGVAIDEDVLDRYNLIQNEIVLPLERVEGVASVEVQGMLEKEVLIELDREKTAASGLNIWQLAQNLGNDNFTMASGNVRDGSRKLMLRSVAKFESLEELRNLRVSNSVRLGDVATITYDEPEKNFRVRAMSKPAVAVVVFKEGEANVRETSKAVETLMDKLNADPRLTSAEMITLFSQGDVIDEALTTLFNSGMIGGVLAVFTLLFFLRRFRLTIILALAIPLSLLIGLTAMYFTGETLNLLTLLGLMICVGLLVDNSVVVAENIHRLHREGMERRQACIHGAGEVGLAITMSTLTTIVVFLPVALVDGPAQFFMMRLALPVCVSVAASLIVALVFIPLCVYLTLPSGVARASSGVFRRGHDRINAVLRRSYELTFGLINKGYGRLLGFFLRRRVELVIAVAIVFVITAAWPMKTVKFVESQENEGGGFGFEVELPQTTTLEEAEEWFLAAEKVVESKKEELGLDGWFCFHRKTFGEIQGWFTRPRTVKISPNEAAEIVRDALPQIPGLELTIMGEREGADDDGGGQSTHIVAIKGEDPDQLADVKDALEDLFVQVPGVLGLKGRAAQIPNELGLIVDRDRTQRLGINPQVVAGVVGLALRGTSLPKFNFQGEEIPVRIRFQEKDRESLTELADFLVPTAAGDFLPVSALTETAYIEPPGTIVRRNKQLGRTITLELEEGKEEETSERLVLLTAGIDLPEGVSFGSNFQAGEFDDDLSGMKFAVLLSVIFIYLLMGFLFESFILPLSIILTIPLSIIGVFWTHLITFRDIDFLGVVAMVLLVGVVVNNGIVLIDYVNRLRNQGMDRRAALLTATERRFRPIMMTAITTIGGMIPLALAGANSIGLSYTSFSLTLIGGMTTATLLTLLVVPVFYTFFDDARDAVSAAWQKILFGRARRDPALPVLEELDIAEALDETFAGMNSTVPTPSPDPGKATG